MLATVSGVAALADLDALPADIDVQGDFELDRRRDWGRIKQRHARFRNIDDLRVRGQRAALEPVG